MPAPACAPRWPTPRASTPTPTAPASAWWRGSRPTTAWCWSNERAAIIFASGPARGHSALCLDGGVLPGAVRFRAEDQSVADRDRAAALSAGFRFHGGVGRAQGGNRGAVARQFQAAGFGRDLHRFLSAQP